MVAYWLTRRNFIIHKKRITCQLVTEQRCIREFTTRSKQEMEDDNILMCINSSSYVLGSGEL